MPNTNLTDSSNHTKALALGTGTNLFGAAARVVLVYLHSLLAARLFGAGAYGVYSVGIITVLLLSLVSQMGLATTVTRFVALHQAKGEPGHVVGTLKLVLRISIPTSIGIGLALVFGAKLLARILGEPALTSSFQVLGFAVPALTLTLLLAAFTQGFKRMRNRMVALDIVRPGVELLGLVTLAWMGARQIGLSIAYLLSLIISSALLIYYAKSDLRQLEKAIPGSTSVPSPIDRKPVLRFAAPVLANNLIVNIADRVSVLMLIVLGTSAMVGVFSILQRLVLLGAVLLFSTNLMFGPLVADLVEHRQFGELSHLYKVATRWMLALSLPFFLTLAFFGAEILQMFGSEFVIGWIALRYLVVAFIFSIATGPAGVVLMMSGRPQYTVINETINLVAVIGFSIWLIPGYGLLGAAWAVTSGIIIANALRLFQVWWHLRIHPYSWSLLKVAIASVTMIIVLWVWKVYVLQGNTAWYLLILGGGLALLAYGGIFITLGLEDEDIEILRTLKRRFILPRVSSS